MTISEAMNAASNEYDIECGKARNDQSFGRLINDILGVEYEEIDAELASYVSDILGALGMRGILDPRYYQMARMCFRMGMRVQRKIDQPDKPTSMLWRS
jgi:hypothetical protein